MCGGEGMRACLLGGLGGVCAKCMHMRLLGGLRGGCVEDMCACLLGGLGGGVCRVHSCTPARGARRGVWRACVNGCYGG